MELRSNWVCDNVQPACGPGFAGLPRPNGLLVPLFLWEFQDSRAVAEPGMVQQVVLDPHSGMASYRPL